MTTIKDIAKRYITQIAVHQTPDGKTLKRPAPNAEPNLRDMIELAFDDLEPNNQTVELVLMCLKEISERGESAQYHNIEPPTQTKDLTEWLNSDPARIVHLTNVNTHDPHAALQTAWLRELEQTFEFVYSSIQAATYEGNIVPIKRTTQN